MYAASSASAVEGNAVHSTLPPTPLTVGWWEEDMGTVLASVHGCPCVPTVSSPLRGLHSKGGVFDVVAWLTGTGTCLENCSGIGVDGNHGLCLWSGHLCVLPCLWCWCLACWFSWALPASQIKLVLTWLFKMIGQWKNATFGTQWWSKKQNGLMGRKFNLFTSELDLRKPKNKWCRGLLSKRTLSWPQIIHSFYFH